MAEFAVWAPNAKTVSLILDGVHRPVVMQRDGDWWRADMPSQAGTKYAFSIDQGAPIPDPRSCYQPDGVHGSSQVVDHDAFEWTDQGWQGFDLHRGVLYELHIGTFTAEGTFDSAIEKLDYLVDLGIDAIEIMPVAEFSGERGWGYDGVDLYAPHHAYGGPDGLKRLIDACHNRGLGVIIDVVYNHLGPDGNYLGAYGPYFTHKHQTPWGDAINYDGEGAAGVRDFVLGNVKLWLKCYHADGLRLDAVHAICDDSPKHIVAEIAECAHFLGSKRGFPAWIIAESDLNDPTVVRDPDKGGWGTDAQWSDDFHHALHALITGERHGYYVDFGDPEDLAKVIRDAYVFTGQHSKFLDRNKGELPKDVNANKFVVFDQNHDQVGNRAAGDRLASLVDSQMLYVAAATVLLSPYVPLLFMGEEWGTKTPFLFFSDYKDEELGRAVTEGRKREFADAGWNDTIPGPQEPESFENSKLDWMEKDQPENARLLEWYKTLIRLRHERPDFVADSRDAKVDGQVLIVQRDAHKLLANFGDSPITIEDVHLEPQSVHIAGL
jgi:maltooligosyltrehalose trehalohydrolase